MLERLPLAAEPNAGVGRHIPFLQISGFTGITLGSEAAVGGNGAPPGQGLAVHDNIVAEIVNRSVQFFKSDGTPLTNPIWGSVFFLAEGFNVFDPQAFFDPKSKRWYFHTMLIRLPPKPTISCRTLQPDVPAAILGRRVPILGAMVDV
jgi:hypothetical protein